MYEAFLWHGRLARGRLRPNYWRRVLIGKPRIDTWFSKSERMNDDETVAKPGRVARATMNEFSHAVEAT
jgi:hypothetical protein